MKNQKIAELLEEIADIEEIMGVPYKPRAYRKAAMNIEGLGEGIVQIAKRGELDDIPGVGKSIAEKIEEFLKTGKIKELVQLRKKTPIKVKELMDIEGLGPKRIKTLYKKLKIKNRKDLERAVKQGKVGKIAGLGKKVEKNIGEGIKFAKTSTQRMFFAQALPIAEECIAYLKEKHGISKIEYAGSLRRGRSTIGDIDILAVGKNKKKIIESFAKYPQVSRVIAKGGTKCSVKLKGGVQVDLRVLPTEQWGAGLLYFTGSKQHSIELRKIAIKKGMKVSEYGIFKGKKTVAAKTEHQCYKALGLQYIPAEMRESTGEIKAAKKRKIPNLIEYKDIRGDLHMHTTASDGAHSILDMAKQAKVLGLKYIAITDHTGKLQIAGGLRGKQLMDHIQAIKKANSRIKNFTILAGAEVNIDDKGELDIDKPAIKKLDIIIGSIHSGHKGSKAKITNRICTAMQHPRMHILGHPTGRLINKRPAYAVDMEKVFKTAKQTKTALEIDAQPARFDLPTPLIKKAKEKGIKMAINSDAHSAGQLIFQQYGVHHARRGWVQKKDIINTMSVSQLKKWAK